MGITAVAEAGGGGGGGVGVGVGIGVGSILLNEAIRRSQERHQAAEPQGCPPGLVPSRKGCVKPGKNKGPEVTKCEPPMQWRKGERLRAARRARKSPNAKRPWRCARADACRPRSLRSPNASTATSTARAKAACRPITDLRRASCDRPFIKIGNGCGCPPGLIERGHDCRPPTVVVVPPPVVVPVGPAPGRTAASGSGCNSARATSAAATGLAGPAEDPAPIQSLAKIEPAANRCLPDDLYDLLEETYGKPPALDRCPSACLPKPASFTPAELDAAAAKSGINWCDNCVQVGGYMPLASVLKLENAANLTICVNPDMCRLPAAIGGPASGRRARHRDPHRVQGPAGRASRTKAISPSSSATRTIRATCPTIPTASADADAVMALLVDQLGYKQENIIDLRDATLSDFERVFGSESDPEGELAERIDKKDPGDVFIYVASHGMVKEDDAKEAYLLPVDAKLDDLDKTAYPMQELYDHLGKIGARTIMLMLEANFAKNLDELIDPPNLPELEVEAMPVDPVPGLAVFKASDRDQKTIKDPEYGIGLFTRYLIEGLAGRADAAPARQRRQADRYRRALRLHRRRGAHRGAEVVRARAEAAARARSTISWSATSPRTEDGRI